MRILRLSTSRDDDVYVVRDDHDQLCGMVRKQDDGRWKIELTQRFVHFEPTRDKAFAWIRGAYAVMVVSEIDRKTAALLAQRRRPLPHRARVTQNPQGE